MRWQSNLSSGQSSPEIRVGSTVPGGITVNNFGLSQGTWACSLDVEIGDTVEITGSGAVGRSQPSAGTGRSIIGFVTQKDSAITCTVQYTGEVTLSKPLIPGSYYYAADEGQISETGVFSGVSQPVGVAKTESILIINITRPITL